MLEIQSELNEERTRLYSELCKRNPGLGAIIESTLPSIYCDGVLNAKTKFMIALAIALASGCRNCVLAQLTRALSSGATHDEIMEVISVVYAMRGTTGVGESLRVVQYLEEMELGNGLS